MNEVADLAHCNTMSALPPCEAVQRAGCIAHYVNAGLVAYMWSHTTKHGKHSIQHAAAASNKLQAKLPKRDGQINMLQTHNSSSNKAAKSALTVLRCLQLA